MKEQDYTLNMLLSLKHIKHLFATFQSEANNETLRNKVDMAYDEILKAQREVYDLMVSKEWMKVSYQTQSAVEKEYKKYEKKSCK